MNNAKGSDFALGKPLNRKNHEIVFAFMTREVYPVETDEMWLDDNKLNWLKALDDDSIKAIEKCSKKIKNK